jgi:uncharacterized protein YdaU (DUF1376 family)
MLKTVHITTPWPTSEEVAKRFRISKRRQKELDAMAEEFFKQQETKGRSRNIKANHREEKRKNASAAA